METAKGKKKRKTKIIHEGLKRRQVKDEKIGKQQRRRKTYTMQREKLKTTKEIKRC